MSIDVLLLGRAGHSPTEAAHRVMTLATRLGDPIPSLLLTGVAATGAWNLRGRRQGLFVLVTPIVAMAVTQVMKRFVGRARPAMGQLVESSPSWPSGHATIALAMALSIALACSPIQRKGQRRAIAAIVTLGTLVGYSRVHLGVHWFSDVAAGWLVALAVTAGIAAAMDRPKAPPLDAAANR